MNKKFTALLMALLLALTLCVPAMAVSEYGVIYDETDSLGSVELDYMGEHALPELSEKLQMDLRIDVFTDEDVSADTDVMGREPGRRFPDAADAGAAGRNLCTGRRRLEHLYLFEPDPGQRAGFGGYRI